MEAYVKASRRAEVDFRREVALLQTLLLPHLPRLLDWDEEGFRWMVTEALPGERLSVIVGEKGAAAFLPCMAEYGEMQARWHTLPGEFPAMPRRRFMEAPGEEHTRRFGCEEARDWLLAHPPGEGTQCLCHGDFHYANVLWQEGRLSAVLDLELAGLGDREFDLAWAIFRRPGQRFMATEELRRYLEGYARRGDFDGERLKYFLISDYAWFLGVGAEDRAYTDWVRAQLRTML
ncbi:MAG: phosphotransferase family protein [Aristaeellaceae bacterium]